jgi:hypothetical protein
MSQAFNSRSDRLSVLGQHAIGLRVLALDLPAVAAVDSLLGLDFFRNLSLLIDFRLGPLTLTSPPSFGLG